MRRSLVVAALLVAIGSGAVANATSRSAPPVGPLPAGPSSTIQTHVGELVALALPNRAGGRVWRIARAIDSRVLVQVSEANVGASVVLVFKAKAAGTATVRFGLTRGERSKAYESRTFTVHVG
jgi:hypothetical protein